MTRSLRGILLLACLAAAAVLLAACGGDGKQEPTPAEILGQTFRSSASAIEDGRLNLSFRLDPEGLLAVGGPVRFTLDGPFRAPRAGRLTQFDIDFVATLAEKEYAGSVLSTGTKVLVTLDDGTYRVDDATVARLRRPASGRAGVPVTGFDPLRWIGAPQRRADERVAGVDTIRIGGRLNVVALLADLDGLLRKAGGSQTGSALLAPKLRRQIAAAVESSTVDIWTGAKDKVLRQLAVKILFFFKDGSSPLQALNGGTINLRMRLDDVNEQAEPASAFAAPEGGRSRPLAELTGGGADNILKGVGAGLTGGKGRELFACLTAANGSSPKLVRCVSRLAP
jgi:ABC-type amino acid transport substrate-binding protein